MPCLSSSSLSLFIHPFSSSLPLQFGDKFSKWAPEKEVAPVITKSKYQQELEDWEAAENRVGRQAHKGKIGPRELARREYRLRQQVRYQQVYRVVMDAMEDVCKTELPESMFKECRPLYAFAERVTDFLIHGYYVDEVCEKIRLCEPGFFDA